jgi:hypothetical protein
MPSPDRHFATAAIFTQSTGLTPNSGDAALYIKSDNKAYIKDSAGAEVIVGGTGTIAGTLGTVDNAVPRADGTGGITAQGSDISIDDATTSTQTNVAITNQHTGQTNSALVLTPKGTGALIAGPKPDGTITGGNARGSYAIDLQLTRNNANQVARGTNYSVILGGANNTSSAFNHSVVCGGDGNTASANYAVVCGGQTGTASAVNSFVAGGQSNTASGGWSFVAGSNNTASGQSAHVLGNLNTASGTDAFCCNGNNQSTANRASALGHQALANRINMQAYASGSFSNTTGSGDAQRARFVMRNKTTTNSAVELFLDGSATRLTVPSGKYLTGTINIAGIKSDGTAAASYIRQFSIKNVAGTTSLVGTVNTIGTDEAASTSISITANDTNDALKVEVTGIASETWRWVAAVDVVEVAYGS